MDKCPTCKFYISKATQIPGTKLSGFCHRYPRLPASKNNGIGFYMTEVTNEDWCGEWRASDEYIKNSGSKI